MEIINLILASPFYSLLIGGGGILVVIISVASIVIQRKKARGSNGIFVNKSKKTSIVDNEFNNLTIDVIKSDDTTIHKNKVDMNYE